MGQNRSKNKGSAYERQLAQTLSDYLGGSWIRAPHSGAYVGGANAKRLSTLSQQQGRTHKGDLIPPDDMQKLVIEAKHYNDFPFHSLMLGKSIAKLDAWIDQAQTSAEAGDCWFVMFKIDRRGEYAVYPRSYGISCTIQVPYADCWVSPLAMLLEQNAAYLKQLGEED